jgi:hypothetical protein
MAVLEVPFFYTLSGTMARCRNDSVVSVADVVPVAIASVEAADVVAIWRGPEPRSGANRRPDVEIPFRAFDGGLWTPVRVADEGGWREATAEDMHLAHARWLADLRRHGTGQRYPFAPTWMTPYPQRLAESVMTQAEVEDRFRRVDADTRQSDRAEAARLARTAFADIGGTLHVKTAGPVWTLVERVAQTTRLAVTPGGSPSTVYAAHPADEPERALARFSCAARAAGKAISGLSDETSVEIPDILAYRAVRIDTAQIVLQAVAMHYSQRNSATRQRVGYLPYDVAAAAAELGHGRAGHAYASGPGSQFACPHASGTHTRLLSHSRAQGRRACNSEKSMGRDRRHLALAQGQSTGPVR